MSNQICFPNHVGLPFQPNPPDPPDGYVEPEPFMGDATFGVDASLVDPGWTNSMRITYGGATSTSLSKPLMDFQGLKHATDDYIYLSFIVRRDTNFDDNDVIILVVQPGFSNASPAKNGDARRLDIFPLKVGVGAENPVPGEDTTSFPPYKIRPFSGERSLEYYKWDIAGSGSWKKIMGVTRPDNLTIKVRSWTDGTANQYNWSVEIKLPTTIAKGGGGAGNPRQWINLGTKFGFYFNVIRLCGGSDCIYTPDGTPTSFQFTWPRADYSTLKGILHDPTGLMSLIDYSIPADWLGEVLLGGTACAGIKGVRFLNGSSGIGIGPSLGNTLSKTAPNEFRARLINTGSSDALNVDAEFRIANWGIGPGGAASWVDGTDPKWNKVPARPDTPGVNSNPSTPQTIPAGGTHVDLTTSWTLSTAEKGMYGTTLHPHQCIWAILHSNQNVDFVESSQRTNMKFGGMSTQLFGAEVSGKGYMKPVDGKGNHEFLLLTSQMVIARRKQSKTRIEPDDFTHRSTERDGEVIRPPFWAALKYLVAAIQRVLTGVDPNIEYRYIWITDGYRRTDAMLTVEGKRYRVYQPADSFGFVGWHTGTVKKWKGILNPASDKKRCSRKGTALAALRSSCQMEASVISWLSWRPCPCR